MKDESKVNLHVACESDIPKDAVLCVSSGRKKGYWRVTEQDDYCTLTVEKLSWWRTLGMRLRNVWYRLKRRFGSRRSLENENRASH